MFVHLRALSLGRISAGGILKLRIERNRSPQRSQRTRRILFSPHFSQVGNRARVCDGKDQPGLIAYPSGLCGGVQPIFHLCVLCALCGKSRLPAQRLIARFDLLRGSGTGPAFLPAIPVLSNCGSAQVSIDAKRPAGKHQKLSDVLVHPDISSGDGAHRNVHEVVWLKRIIRV